MEDEVEAQGLCDIHTGACCYESSVSWVCRILSKPDCAEMNNSFFLGHDVPCPRGGSARHVGLAVTHYTTVPEACRGLARSVECIPGNPVDPWKTDPSETMCHRFDVPPESPPIPAGFFGAPRNLAVGDTDPDFRETLLGLELVKTH